MPSYRGLSGKSYKLEEKPFAGGGEGQIYSVPANPRLVAKIYHEGLRTQERRKKLKTMMDSAPTGDAANYFTWPKDVLVDGKGKFCGYVMQRLEAKKRLNEFYIYDPASGISWDVYITVAMNMSAAVSAVHKRGHVCGDLNPNNICVNPGTGIITLVDTDSYHIKDPKSGKIFRCEVGMAEFLPKNLQGINFKNAPLPTFTEESDAFALAVLIFCLLMNGAHPYACSVTHGISGCSRQPAKNIANDFYPHNANINGVSIPKYAPKITALPKEMRDMFISAFLTRRGAKRPTARDWYHALERLSRQLKKCSKNPAHVFFNGLKDCPWCQVKEEMRDLRRKLDGSGTDEKQTEKTTIKPISRRGSSRDWGNILPHVLVWLFALAYSGAFGYGAFLLISRYTFVWAIVGGVAIGIVSMIAARIMATDFIEWPELSSFLLLVVFWPFFGLFMLISSLLSLSNLPHVLVWAFTLAYSAAIGYGAFWLITRISSFLFTWGIIGGVVAAVTSIIYARNWGTDFIDDPGVVNFLVFVGGAPVVAVLSSLRSLGITLVVFLVLSLALSILGSIFS